MPPSPNATLGPVWQGSGSSKNGSGSGSSGGAAFLMELKPFWKMFGKTTAPVGSRCKMSKLPFLIFFPFLYFPFFFFLFLLLFPLLSLSIHPPPSSPYPLPPPSRALAA
jgi:hypothetical protein